MHEFKASHMILIYQGCKPLHRNLKIAARALVLSIEKQLIRGMRAVP